MTYAKEDYKNKVLCKCYHFKLSLLIIFILCPEILTLFLWAQPTWEQIIWGYRILEIVIKESEKNLGSIFISYLKHEN